LTLVSVSARASGCSTVPENTYEFIKTQMLAKIKKERLTLVQARDLPSKFGKFLGMIIEESGGDAAKIALHGKETQKGSYTLIKDWQNKDVISASSKEVDANIETFIARANYQTNFGLAQISADQAAYAGKSHKFVQARLAEVQEMAKNNPAEAIEYCGADHLFRDSKEDLQAAFKKLAGCNPVLSTRVVGKQTLPVNDNPRLRCFARIAMMCPGMSLQIMNVYPKGNWGTADAKKKCVAPLEDEVEKLFKGGSLKDESDSKDHSNT
jgi:hypothetical protein